MRESSDLDFDQWKKKKKSKEQKGQCFGSDDLLGRVVRACFLCLGFGRKVSWDASFKLKSLAGVSSNSSV
jgi:hypothetical protein